MKRYRYLIAGGGMTADAAVRGIRELDQDGSIGVIGAEVDPPYKRPPLSKKLWTGNALDTIWLKTGDRGAELHLGHVARSIDLAAKQVTDERGESFGFEKLLLATGVSPRRLPFGGDDVIYFRTLADYRRLRTATGERSRFAVVGGGFIGSEVAASLAMNGKHATLIFPNQFVCERLFPADLASFVTDRYRAEGVDVFAGDEIEGIECRAAGIEVAVRTPGSDSFRTVVADGVVAGIGTIPNTALAQSAGLAIDNGIVVDAHLRTTHPDVYAAGDVASFMQSSLGKRIRLEHEDNAKTMGRAAGRAMAGDPTPYDYLPFFYSDMFDLGYEAVGSLDSRLETIADWAEPFRRGVIYYLEAGRVRGVLLWNVWNRTGDARALIAEPGPFTRETVIGRIPTK